MEQKAINALRFLGVDAINRANSGHPGIVLGAAPMAYTLFSKHLNTNVKESDWINRDRFILSAGHGSMLLYGLNHLSGFDISMENIKHFRQPGNTPGHPEYGHTDGVETTSGPLGQGISNAVGMAIAEAHLGAKFNREGYNIIDHYTYVICGDGDLQEGVALEAMSLAGHLGLNKLIVLFDSNDIQLDGEVKLAYSDNHHSKFSAMNWNYLRIEDGNDTKDIHEKINLAKKSTDKPTIIEIKTTIGYGTKDAGTSKVHGSPIGEAEALKLRETLNWEYQPFDIPKDVYDHYRKVVKNRGKKVYDAWRKMYEEYAVRYPEDFNRFIHFIYGTPKIDFDQFQDLLKDEKEATRNISGKIIERLSNQYENLIGGSADLSASTKAKGANGNFTRENRLGRNINFGVREHAMGAIINGMVLHGGLRVFGGAFFVFSDYMKPAIRLSAIMNIPSIFVFTHDSIAVGEDGPTHQPIEQLAGLRAIPNLNVIRPADAIETFAAWKIAMESKGTPTAIILTRQNVMNSALTHIEGAEKGAYILSKEHNQLDGIIIATGSEVETALNVQKQLFKQGKDVRVVSMPSMFLFLKQSKKYQKSILPKNKKKIAIEMASSMSWYQFADAVYGIDTFGISAPQKTAIEKFGFTTDKVCEFILKKLK